MPVRIDAAELQRVLELTPHTQNIMLVGRHGIGKSQIITESFRGRGIKVVSFFLGQMSDPGDLIGLMHRDEATGRSVFLPPYWWPTDDTPVALFLDELNRARPEILQSVMELTLNKTLAGRSLPAGSVIVSAVNDGDQYQLTDLDPALVSRFNLYEFAPTVDDWMVWATRHDIDQRVRDFILQYPEHLDGDTAGVASTAIGSELTKTPDRRGWARVSALIAGVDRLDTMHIKLVAGIVGTAAATAFRNSLSHPLPVSPAQVLLELTEHRKVVEKLSLTETLLLGEQLVHWLGSDPRAGDQTTVIHKNLLSYLKGLRRRKLTEAIAHFVTLLTRPEHVAAMAVVTESMPLTEFVTDYIDGVKIE